MTQYKSAIEKEGDKLARPQKEGMDYFPHDTDATSDEKIEALMMLYGTKGYAFYFILLERIYRSPNFEIDISDAETIQILSRKMTITTEEFHQILNSAIKHRCFDREKYEKEGVLTSNGIKKRASIVTEKREKMRAKYDLQKKIISDAETTQETGAETPQSKEKKSKVKKNININKYAEFVSMTEEEYQKLIQAYGEEKTKRMIQILDNYKGANGKKYKSDYRAILNWVVDRVEKEGVKGGTNKPATENKPAPKYDKSKWLA